METVPTKILVVEDDSSLGSVIKSSLETFGYSVPFVVASGEAAVQRVEENRPDLILMDILLKGDLDGVAAAEQILNRFHVPVIYLTAYADESTIQRAKLTAPYGFLLKPFDAKQLNAAIQIAMQKQKLEEKSRLDSLSLLALQNLGDAVMITDQKGLIRYMNPAAESLTGWNLSEVAGKVWTDVFHTERTIPVALADSSLVTEVFSGALRDEALLSCRDGRKVHVNYTAAPLRDDSRKTTGYVLMFLDLTDRRKIEDALAASRKKYKDLVNAIDGIVWEADRDHHFSYTSKKAQRFLGYPMEDWLQDPGFWKSHLHMDDSDWVTSFFEKRMTHGTTYELEYRMHTADGRTIWVRDIGTIAVEEGSIRLRGVLMDATERKQMEDALRRAHHELDQRVHERTRELSRVIAELQNEVAERKRAENALRESEERYSLAVTGANDGLWDWNLKTSEIYFSARWKSMLGYSEKEIGNQPSEWFTRVHPDDVVRMKAEVSVHLEGKTSQFQNEHRMLHKDGTFRWMLTRGVAVRDSVGAYRMAGSQTDITERKLAVEQLLHDAFHDALTNLPNRALFMDRLTGAAARSAARGKRGRHYLFSVLFLDLDRFKVVNDSLGHMIGDQLLIGIARRLERWLRPGDTIARLGGDEFAILLEDIVDVKDAIVVAERIQVELHQPFTLEGQEVFTSASIGIALSSAGYEKGEDLLRDADTAMYHAKGKGKARYEVFDRTMHGTAVALLQLETDLRRAVERDEFRLYFQAIVGIPTRKVVGFEALVRWQHPERGLLMPEEVIPLAEETGLILPIGKRVLREACQRMQEWHREYPTDPPLTITVNLSPQQFSQPDLVENIAQILDETQLPPDTLGLEITESLIMEKADFAISTLHRLRALNVRLLIDDFGTGYSSLSYLHRFPITTLKIDRSFVSRIESNREDREIIRTIVTLAQTLGMDVVAEGVETEEQLQHLQSLGCEKAQGYFFSKPLEHAEVAELIKIRPQIHTDVTDYQ
jgi:diguanylate cyclase (GGDEF)-like protein/PAS domain S-box-containing protein